MPRQITIGGLDPATLAAETLALPVLPGMTALPIIRDALDHAVTQRKGAVVIGAKGMGKTMARGLAVDEHHEAEADREDADGSYEPRRLVSVLAPCAASPRDVYVDLHTAIIDATPATRVHGRQKTLGELRHSLLLSAAEEGVVAIVLDECERLSPEGATVLRDLLSGAEEMGRGGRAGAYVRPAGLGLLMLGTPEFRVKIERSSEAGQRWAHCAAIPPLAREEIPPIYLTYFPKFHEAALDMGTHVWHEVVTDRVLRGRPTVSLRLIDTHAREYYRLLVRNGGATYDRRTAPFDLDLFAYSANEANWTITPAASRQAA